MLSQREQALLEEIARLRRQLGREETREYAAGTAGGGSVDAFTDLTDTPSAYTGSANAFLRVGSGTASVVFGTVDWTDIYNKATAGTATQGIAAFNPSYFAVDGGTVALGTVPWAILTDVPSTFTPSTHGSTHWAAGTDPVGTATPTADAIPYADGSGLLDAWISLAGTATPGRAAFTAADFSVSGGTASIGTAVPRFSDLSTVGTSGAYSDLTDIPSTFAPSAHAASHQDSGGDEIGTATPGANAIPKADGSGLLDAWISLAGTATRGRAAFTSADFAVSGGTVAMGTAWPRYTGTPTAGQLAQWSGAGTLTHSGYAGSAVARYSGVPTPGNYTYWSAAGTVADSGFGTADLPRYSGTPTAGAIAHWTGAGTVADAGFGTANVARLDVPNTFAPNQTIAGTATSGTALAVTRNLSSGSTNAPVVSFIQDHASDDQPVLRLQQDAPADIIKAYYGANEIITAGPNGGLSATLSVDGTSFGSTAYGNLAIYSDQGSWQLVAFGSARSSTSFGQALAGAGRLRVDGMTRFLLGTNNSSPLHFGTNDTLAMTINGSQNIGIGSNVTSPQGKLHVHDGSLGFLLVTKTGINGTAQTIIPNGTGDVLYVLRYEVVLRDTSGGAAAQTGTLLGPSTSATITTAAGNDVDLRINADGSVDIRRTAGSRTFQAGIRLQWL